MLTVYETPRGLMIQRGSSFVQIELPGDGDVARRMLERLEREGRIRYVRREMA